MRKGRIYVLGKLGNLALQSFCLAYIIEFVWEDKQFMGISER